MTDATAHLLLPYLQASQAQKHVTLNESLRLLDGLVQLAVLDADRTAPPAAAVDGDRHLVAAGAGGDWLGWDDDIALRADGAWLRLPARPGWTAWVAAEASLRIFDAAAWRPLPETLSLLSRAGTVRVAEGPFGSAVEVVVAEDLLAGLAGPFVDSAAVIPDRAIVLGVSVRVVSEIAGASSFDVGVAGEPARFGAALGVTAGSSNAGVIGPTAVYADTQVRLTANGGDFAGGAVRLALHMLRAIPPQS